MTFLSTMCLTAVSTERGRVPPIPAADHETIRNYRIDDDVLRRLLAVSADAQKAHVGGTWFFAQLFSYSLDDITDRVLTKQPRLARIVEKHGFGRREYMTAVFALASARKVALYGPEEPEVHDQFVSSKNASDANIAFYESHQALLEPLMGGGPVTQANRKRIGD
ncbi:hypothetical protein [Luteibacter yeojuensis]|uniref:Uncharacterized protein n=1 Tax=Luteibacter yeojuensis TaxID=345309 RepID=A0A7X5QRV8_9GAMM|nr:hypothetical protein [Luteibacter yeojuensis]NID14245.1 hypothetical protein [Luteibacter yeojuensis]